MNLFKRARDRLSGVLGYDYQGKPLRCGDLVEPAPGIYVDEFAKCQMTVKRLPDENDRMSHSGARPVFILSSPVGYEIAVKNWHAMAKVPDDQRDEGWQNVQRVTGWRPTAIAHENPTTTQ